MANKKHKEKEKPEEVVPDTSVSEKPEEVDNKIDDVLPKNEEVKEVKEVEEVEEIKDAEVVKNVPVNMKKRLIPKPPVAAPYGVPVNTYYVKIKSNGRIIKVGAAQYDNPIYEKIGIVKPGENDPYAELIPKKVVIPDEDKRQAALAQKVHCFYHVDTKQIYFKSPMFNHSKYHYLGEMTIGEFKRIYPNGKVL